MNNASGLFETTLQQHKSFMLEGCTHKVYASSKVRGHKESRGVLDA